MIPQRKQPPRFGVDPDAAQDVPGKPDAQDRQLGYNGVKRPGRRGGLGAMLAQRKKLNKAVSVGRHVPPRNAVQSRPVSPGVARFGAGPISSSRLGAAGHLPPGR